MLPYIKIDAYLVASVDIFLVFIKNLLVYLINLDLYFLYLENILYLL